jgi:hypothetical protein
VAGKSRVHPVHDIRETRLACHHSLVNAVNRDIHLIKIVLWVDQSLPSASDFTVLKGDHADLADACQVRIRCLHIYRDESV